MTNGKNIAPLINNLINKFEKLNINMHKNEIGPLFYTMYKKSMQNSKVLSSEIQNYSNIKYRKHDQC